MRSGYGGWTYFRNWIQIMKLKIRTSTWIVSTRRMEVKYRNRADPWEMTSIRAKTPLVESTWRVDLRDPVRAPCSTGSASEWRAALPARRCVQSSARNSRETHANWNGRINSCARYLASSLTLMVCLFFSCSICKTKPGLILSQTRRTWPDSTRTDLDWERVKTSVFNSLVFFSGLFKIIARFFLLWSIDFGNKAHPKWE